MFETKQREFRSGQRARRMPTEGRDNQIRIRAGEEPSSWRGQKTNKKKKKIGRKKKGESGAGWSRYRLDLTRLEV